MSRCNYSEDYDNWSLIRWRGAVTSAIRGKRGQAFLKEMAAALDELDEPRLIANDLEHPLGGLYCSLGAVCRRRGLDMLAPDGLDGEDTEAVVKALDIPEALVREIMYENDDFSYQRFADQLQEQRARWRHMRNWVNKHLAPTSNESTHSA